MQEQFIKLTNAVYTLLEFFPDSDPSKNRAKERALAITESLTLIFGTEGWASFQKEKARERLFEDIYILLGYLELGKMQGWINGLNFLIISKEYEKIINELKLKPGPAKKPIEFQVLADNPKKPVLPLREIPPRQAKILQILREKGKAQVSDLKTVLLDVTKRTIRRDLDDLLKKGAVTRLGEFNQVFYKIHEVHEIHEFHEDDGMS